LGNHTKALLTFKDTNFTVELSKPLSYPLHKIFVVFTELAKLLGNRTRALLTFEDANFTVEGFLANYLGQLSEKAIDNARQDLGALLATCTEEVRLLGAKGCLQL
jgi:hypothetical protein